GDQAFLLKQSLAQAPQGGFKCPLPHEQSRGLLVDFKPQCQRRRLEWENCHLSPPSRAQCGFSRHPPEIEVGSLRNPKSRWLSLTSALGQTAVTVAIMIATPTIGDIVATMTGDIDTEHKVVAMLPSANGAATNLWSGMCAVATDRERSGFHGKWPYLWGHFLLSCYEKRAMCGRLLVGKSFVHGCSSGRSSHVFGLSVRFT